MSKQIVKTTLTGNSPLALSSTATAGFQMAPTDAEVEVIQQETTPNSTITSTSMAILKLEKLKEAIVKAHNEHYGDNALSLDQILEVNP